MKTLNIFFTLIIAIISLNLSAQDIQIERSGFVFGFSAGAGVVSLSDNEAGFDQAEGGITFPSLKLGWMVSERTAIVAVMPGMIYNEDQKDRSFESIIPSVQYWAGDRFWLSGGVGLGMDMPAFYEADDFADGKWDFGCAATAAIGYEIVQRKKFALDLQSRVHVGRIFTGEDQTRDGAAFSVGLGFNWY